MRRSMWMIWPLCAALVTSACDGAKPAQQGQSHEHAGHKHAGHEHAGHEHAGHDHEQLAKRASTSIPADQSGAAKSANGRFWISYTPSPNPIPFQDSFSLEVKIMEASDQATLVTGATLDQARATMPAHSHGMKVEPTIKPGAQPGVFKVEGMRFHMQGDDEDGRWLLELVARDDQGVIDTASFDVQCCR